ncbi:LptA/OstA family protein [Synechococcus sp. PCC 7336]|uniref:LptA/OstA family protein n=1 Tax=Synechococcus sp. PCC 7336 TaxID=195250 RepID=UPI0003496870|nr:LptA/OstA family protein [Synechococcus sp. PCC 7336]
MGWARLARRRAIAAAISLGNVLLVGELAIAQSQISIVADDVEYDDRGAIVRASGNFAIRQGRAEAMGPLGSYNNLTGQSIFTDGVTLSAGAQRFEAQRLEGNHRDELFLLEGNVVYRPNATLTVLTSAAIYDATADRVMLSGPIELVHPQWRATAERVEVTAETIALSGNVQVVLGDRDPQADEVQQWSRLEIHRRTQVTQFIE